MEIWGGARDSGLHESTCGDLAFVARDGPGSTCPLRLRMRLSPRARRRLVRSVGELSASAGAKADQPSFRDSVAVRCNRSRGPARGPGARYRKRPPRDCWAALLLT